MKVIEAELSKGSYADPMILLSAFLFCVLGFSFMYETDFWVENEYSWKPLIILGVALFLVYFYRRLFSGKLRFALAKEQGSSVLFQKAEHITASGWVLAAQEKVAKKDILCVKVDNFYNVATNTGMYWVCFTLKDRRVIEYSVNDRAIVENIKDFVSRVLPDAELEVGERA
jgi:hypothetical protein